MLRIFWQPVGFVSDAHNLTIDSNVQRENMLDRFQFYMITGVCITLLPKSFAPEGGATSNIRDVEVASY